MVYDGADGHYSVVENFLPPGNAGNVMITSRNIGLKRFALNKSSMEIHGMEDEDAISLLWKSAMLDDTDTDIYNLAQQLVSQLDGIPLAIDQAGAYIHSCGCSINGYLELYTRHKNELMRDTPGFEGASDYGTSTYIWDMGHFHEKDGGYTVGNKTVAMFGQVGKVGHCWHPKNGRK